VQQQQQVLMRQVMTWQMLARQGQMQMTQRRAWQTVMWHPWSLVSQQERLLLLLLLTPSCSSSQLPPQQQQQLDARHAAAALLQQTHSYWPTW
jgi:secreted protein with Ig-like and vWFA domain